LSVTSGRSTAGPYLEAIAEALRVAPAALAEQAFPSATAYPVTAETQAAVIA
jgi:hypothetical protein